MSNTIEQAHAEAFKRYDGDRIVDERTGEEVSHDDWGYAEAARQAFIAGVEWIAAERDALAAVIEEARRIHAPGRTVDMEVMYDDPLGDVLFGTPPDVLVERDARIRAEVIDWIDSWAASHGRLDQEPYFAVREHFGLTKGADRG